MDANSEEPLDALHLAVLRCDIHEQISDRTGNAVSTADNRL
jgi:hypothetical protein